MVKNHKLEDNMLLKTRVLDLCYSKSKDTYELAQAMKISVNQLHSVHQDGCNITKEFIIGALRAFPEYNIGDLFYFTS